LIFTKDKETPIKRCRVLTFEHYGSPSCDGNAAVNKQMPPAVCSRDPVTMIS